MGSDAGRWLAALERSTPGLKDRMSGLGGVLGGIEVSVEMEGTWVRVGEIQEQGPLAVDESVIPLPEGTEGTVRVRLTLTRGKHRLDRVGLVALEAPVEPVRIPPAEVLRDGRDDAEALRRLTDPEEVLVTGPGDAYTLIYDLHEVPSPAGLFLESRGYYLEWIRESWIQDQGPAAVARILIAPRDALRQMAPAFKATEDEMEAVFWSSKYARP